MKLLRSVGIVLALAIALPLGYDNASSILYGVDRAYCGGLKPESRPLCWRNVE